MFEKLDALCLKKLVHRAAPINHDLVESSSTEQVLTLRLESGGFILLPSFTLCPSVAFCSMTIGEERPQHKIVSTWEIVFRTPVSRF